MRIGVVAPAAVPYTRGGFERLLSGLVNHLNDKTSHQAELIKLPFPETTLHEVMAGYRAFAAMDLSGFDMIISAKYPAWMVDHPNHRVYLCHTLRGLYDTYPADFPTRVDPAVGIDDLIERLARTGRDRSVLPEVFGIYDEAVARLGHDDPVFGHPGPLGRSLVHTLDRVGLSTAAVRRHLAIAHTVAERENYFPHDAAVGVVHPPTDIDARPTADAGDYFFTASRLDAPKRIDLIIQAFRQTSLDNRLVIAGSGPERDRLLDLAKGDSRIDLLGFVPDDDLPDLYSGAIAVPFVPDREDYGLIALEALASGTPVITCRDSGGPTELVDPGVTGLIVEPDVSALAEALTAMGNDPQEARRMGQAGRRSIAHITWENLSSKLVGPAAPSRAPIKTDQHVQRNGKALILVLNTFTAHNPKGGGQLRAFHLYRSLSRFFDVHLLSLAPPDSGTSTVTSAPGFSETAIPRTHEHARYEDEMAAAIGIPVNDLYGGLAIAKTPAYLSELSRLLKEADAVLLAHPYMEPALRLVPSDLPVIYDAYNVEARLKDAMYPRNDVAADAIEAVRGVEAATIERASLVAACSSDDIAMMTSVYGPLPSTEVVANGTDLRSIEFVHGVARINRRKRWLKAAGFEADKRLALYLASWHQPNLEAAEEIHKIAPQLPEVLFLMVGSHVDYFAGRALPPNVLQLGQIGDATKRILLGSADFGINPMEKGSGTNLKIVEYLAAGLVTVTTKVGARGLPEDSDSFITAGVPGFATALRDMCTIDHDDPLVESAAHRGRRMVEDIFGWSTIGARFAEAIEREVM